MQIGRRFQLVIALTEIESCERKKRAKTIEYKDVNICEECLRDGLDVEVSSIEGFTKIELGR